MMIIIIVLRRRFVLHLETRNSLGVSSKTPGGDEEHPGRLSEWPLAAFQVASLRRDSAREKTRGIQKEAKPRKDTALGGSAKRIN